MQEKLKKFFDSISYVDKNNDYEQAIISKVVLNKKKESFEIVIENDKPINPVSVLELIKAYYLIWINQQNSQ